MAFIQLPFRGSVAVYDFSTTIGSATYTFLVGWNYRENAWYMNITDADNNVIINSVKLCLGAFLGRTAAVSPFTDGVLVAIDRNAINDGGVEAGFDDLGTRVVIRYVETADLLTMVAQANDPANQ
jgi:hypothetical protein